MSLIVLCPVCQIAENCVITFFYFFFLGKDPHAPRSNCAQGA